MIFNEVAKNYDDHVKNISFLMDKGGRWKLAPAYDMTFSYSRASFWTSSHQMRINGKRDKLTIEDMVSAGKNMGLTKKTINTALQEVIIAVREWPEYAKAVQLDKNTMNYIKQFHKYSDLYKDKVMELPLLEGVKNMVSPYSELKK